MHRHSAALMALSAAAERVLDAATPDATSDWLLAVRPSTVGFHVVPSEGRAGSAP